MHDYVLPFLGFHIEANGMVIKFGLQVDGEWAAEQIHDDVSLWRSRNLGLGTSGVFCECFVLTKDSF